MFDILRLRRNPKKERRYKYPVYRLDDRPRQVTPSMLIKISVKSPNVGDHIRANTIVSDTNMLMAILRAIARVNSVTHPSMCSRRTKAIPGQINRNQKAAAGRKGAPVKIRITSTSADAEIMIGHQIKLFIVQIH